MTINAINIIPCKTASCSVMGDYAIKKKMNIKKGKAKKGDLVLFDFNHNGTSDHIGIVVSVNSGSYTTIEGNTGSGSNTNGGQVQIRTRYNKDINYFVRPKYDSKVTADMAIATARAEVGTVESPKNSNKVKYNTWYYGKEVKGSAYPWCATFICWVFAHIKEEEKPIPKPTGKYSGTIPTPTLKKGSKGTQVGYLQSFLNWYGNFGLKVDKEFGSNTESALKKFQKAEGISADGIYGKQSQAKANTYKATPTTPTKPTTTTNAQKLIAQMDKLSWKYGTAKSKYDYKTGAPTSACKTAMSKHGYKTKAKQSDCGNFVNTIVREAGIDKDFTVLHGVKTAFPSKESKFNIVFKGKAIPSGTLKAGDIIRFKKSSGQHAMFYYGNGRVCDAGHYNRFANIRADEKRYSRSEVKKNTIQVLRVKE